jgi:Fic family protein
MAFAPQFTVSAPLLRELEVITALKTRIAGATVQVAWIPQLAKDSRQRGAHASTAIEGNPLTLAEVRALEGGTSLPARTARPQREVLNYFAGLRWVEKRAKQPKPVTHEDLFRLHRLLADEVMDQGEAGRYRTIAVRVGKHRPPAPDLVSGLMRELLDWWSGPGGEWSPMLTSAILHYQFEEIHPFADGNGRAGRMLALWELYRRGFDTHHIFSIDEFFWEDRPRYYASLAAVPKAGGDLTRWLEYTTEGVRLTLERVWLRVQLLAAKSGPVKVVLRPSQERLLHLLRDQPAGLTPAEIWAALGVTKQGAAHILGPLLKAKLVRRVGTRKSGRYLSA